ncbi:thioredoxin family protein (plasmid) [Cupriavidus sp. KK10]|jgi:thiol-disulfide isomerase/thioredoxin|uniref:thioredoxin family protein n=1 Tax=Cupriavidus sp. KK10 TaxID=1478019 RepID=UPI001BAAC75D|nr:thioredoxin family protein [Cupriavidus sp. KK10]QUN32443.1 thioredoxin family protein [Cupriavidus sp. KK10]
MRTLFRIAIAAAVIAVACFIGLGRTGLGPTVGDQGRAPEFGGIDQWLNSPPLTMESLRGKVVLIDFWTYSCGNCINTLPYLKQWHEKYKDQGLVIVGVHTPEFPFEKSTGNLKEALKRYDIRYPVAQDNGYAMWSAYRNQYWPATYLIDANGHIVYQHYGEGSYDETEATIRKLLAERPHA